MSRKVGEFVVRVKVTLSFVSGIINKPDIIHDEINWHGNTYEINWHGKKMT